MNQQTPINPEENINPIEKYGIDLTQLAKEGKIDPVIGREDEIRRIIQILSRRTKNNPVLIGDPGTGKTTVVEGLARRIFEGDVPDNIKGKKLVTLDAWDQYPKSVQTWGYGEGFTPSQIRSRKDSVLCSR